MEIVSEQFDFASLCINNLPNVFNLLISKHFGGKFEVLVSNPKLVFVISMQFVSSHDYRIDALVTKIYLPILYTYTQDVGLPCMHSQE